MPQAEAPQWVINLSVIAGALVTALAGWIMKKREEKAELARQATGTGAITLMAGTLSDTRMVERLIDQMAHNERATRDLERSLIDTRREIEASTGVMGEFRRILQARADQDAAESERLVTQLVAAISKVPR